MSHGFVLARNVLKSTFYIDRQRNQSNFVALINKLNLSVFVSLLAPFYNLF